MTSGNDLTERLDAHLKTLRKADNQAAAVAWMTAAYRLMEESIEALKQKPVTSTIERLIFVPAKPTIQIAHVVPVADARRPFYTKERPVWTRGETVVYPEVPMPIPKPLSIPKAWTHRDTLRLERSIQKRGR